MTENFVKYASNPVLIASQAWESGSVIESTVILESGTFKMWYRAAGGIGYATSSDGKTWTKYASNPVLANGGGETIELSWVMKISTTYYLYAIKHTSLTNYYLYRWSSSDGITWNIDNSGNPVLLYDAGIAWESYAIYNPSVLYDPTDTGKEYKLLYEAAGWGQSQGFKIGYAYSSDGLNWTKSTSNPVLPNTSATWKSAWTGNPCLIKIGTYYYCIYGGCDASNWKIGLSRSTDMVTWEDALNNPIIESTEAYENGQCADPDILYDVTGKDHKVYLFYGTNQSTISLATLTTQNLSDYFLEDEVFAYNLTFPTDWKRRCAITIDHTKVKTDYNDYPLLLSYNLVNTETNLPDDIMLSGGANACQANGGDIRFTSDEDGTSQLACEIEIFEQFDPISGARAKIWVKCNLSTSVDTIIYLWYKTDHIAYQPSSDNTYGKYSVWSNYDDVWHLGDTASPNVSSKRDNDFTWSGSGNAQDASGKIGEALSLNGNGKASASYHAGYSNSTSHSVSFWAKLNNPVGSGLAFMLSDMGTEGSGSGEAFTIRTDNNWQQFYSQGAYTAYAGNYNLSFGQWYYFVYTITAGSPATLKLYYNANLQTFGQQAGTLIWSANNNLLIGDWVAGNYPFSGSMQEVKIKSGVLSLEQIQTEYYNQNAPETFVLNVGNVEIISSGSNNISKILGYNSADVLKIYGIDINSISKINGLIV